MKRFRKTLSRVLPVFGAVMAVLFVMAALFGGLRFQMPWGRVVRFEAQSLLWITLVLCALGERPAWWRHRGDMPENGRLRLAMPVGGLVGLLLGLALVWGRFLYRAYMPALRSSADGTALFPRIHLMFLIAGFGGIVALFRLRRTGYGSGAWVAAFFWMISPLGLPAGRFITAGYAVAATGFLVGPLLTLPLRTSARYVRVVATAGVLLVAFLVAHWADVSLGLSWSGGRSVRNVLAYAIPGGGAGLFAVLWFWPGVRNAVSVDEPFRSAVLLGLAGLVLAGIRFEPGQAGAVLCLPFAALALAGVVDGCRQTENRTRSVWIRNLLLLCLVGVWMNRFREGIDTGVVPSLGPVMAEERSMDMETDADFEDADGDD